jgi:hypothetical protein
MFRENIKFRDWRSKFQVTATESIQYHLAGRLRGGKLEKVHAFGPFLAIDVVFGMDSCGELARVP